MCALIFLSLCRVLPVLVGSVCMYFVYVFLSPSLSICVRSFDFVLVSIFVCVPAWGESARVCVCVYFEFLL